MRLLRVLRQRGPRSNQGYTYDNLNRMTASPGFVYQNDVLGNRTWRNHGQSGVQRYVWDELNRLKSLSGTESSSGSGLKPTRGAAGSGGGSRTRTDGLLLAKQALYQLSYTPVESGVYRLNGAGRRARSPRAG